MTSSNILAARAERAHEEALRVVREHGPAERVENLQEIPVAYASPSNPYQLVSFQAEMIAALAAIVEQQDRRITALENAAPATAATDPAKKGKKA